MKTIIVRTQAELDALPDRFDEYTVIEIRSKPEDRYIQVTKAWESSRVVARDSSRVVARDSSSVEAWDSSSVEARDSSSVEAWGSSTVEARESSSVEAWESSRVEARDSSSVEARESSSVVARDSSRVEARESSSVEAWGSVGVHLEGVDVTVLLYGFAVCWKKAQGTIKKESETATIIEPIFKEGVTRWCENEAIKVDNGKVIVFKRVSKKWQTQEGTKNETIWEPGKTLEHHDWRPNEEECGEGKYHACSRAYFCDEFRNLGDDRYVALEVAIEDMYAWPRPSYPHKIAFRKCKVLHECDQWGDKIETKNGC